MERTKKNKVDAILTADWHLREDVPVCRTDDFAQAQWDKLSFIHALQDTFQCPVLLAGDMFNIWRSSLALVNKSMSYLPAGLKTIYGNHDLPQHNPALKHKTAINLLERAGMLEVLNGAHYGQMPTEANSITIAGRKILLWHVMCYTGFIPYATEQDWKPDELLKAYPNYDLILTGHNHTSFTYEKNGRLLVNPGAITRQSATNTATKPVVFLWTAKTNTVKPVYLPISEGVVTREHITVKEEKSERLEAFISKLDTDWGSSINFEENLKAFEAKNPIRKEVIDIIHESINI